MPTYRIERDIINAFVVMKVIRHDAIGHNLQTVKGFVLSPPDQTAPPNFRGLPLVSHVEKMLILSTAPF